MESKFDEIVLEEGYIPTDKEEYMCDKHKAFFRRALLDWKSKIAEDSSSTLSHLQEESLDEPDMADRATAETEISLELRSRNRLAKLVAIIDEALGRIEKDDYGFCAETGEPIGLRRLMARPTAKLSLEAQERHEKFEKLHNKIIKTEIREEDDF